MRWKLRWKKHSKKIGLGLIGLGMMIALWLAMDLTQKVQILFSEATAKKAEIWVESKNKLGPVPQGWKNLAQGGEEASNMLKNVTAQTAALNPRYIRIDHVYDYYETVKKENGQLIFNFSKLDEIVGSILQSGAKPFLALSYMPVGLGSDVTAVPDDWNEWKTVVRRTIEHFSGKTNKNIDGVYYEVWNEPDLFGDWKVWGSKNYLELYRWAALGAMEVNKANSFKIGGPATTGLYKNWVEGLVKMADEQNLRLDFISWHRYSMETDDFLSDVNLINQWLEKYPRQAYKEKVISEWGMDANNHPGYDTVMSAAHSAAVIFDSLGKVNNLFLFEIKDGPSPDGRDYWGRWGLMTHESGGLKLKPRYSLMLFLNQLKGERLELTGQGSFVKATAVENEGIIMIFLVNFDKYLNHRETVPITVKDLDPGRYEVVKEWFLGKSEQKQVVITEGTLVDSVSLEPNQAVVVKILK